MKLSYMFCLCGTTIAVEYWGQCRAQGMKVLVTVPRKLHCVKPGDKFYYGSKNPIPTMDLPMNEHAQNLVYPMTFFVVYIFLFMGLQYRMRVRAGKSGEMSYKYFFAYDADKFPPSEKVIVWKNHYANTFQVPIMFMIGCVAHMVVGLANLWTLGLAWLFVALRLLHAFEHLGRNSLKRRPMFFALGTLVVVLMYLQLCWFVATGT